MSSSCLPSAEGQPSDLPQEAMLRQQRVFLVRHGEGLHNATRNYKLVDPSLTDRGFAQAKALKEDPRLVGADLVVVSPLLRALQTALTIFGPSPQGRFMISSLHSEIARSKCDRGRPKGEIAADLPDIVAWDGFEDLPERWMLPRSDDKRWRQVRLPAFRAWLTARPEKHVVVVGHCEFFKGVCGRALDNCEVFEVPVEHLSSDGPPIESADSMVDADHQSDSVSNEQYGSQSTYKNSKEKARVELVSFGYAVGSGQPRADAVFSARHISNPDGGPKTHLTGLDARLRKEVMKCAGAEELFQEILADILHRLKTNDEICIAVGCNFGKHRSVTLCEELGQHLKHIHDRKIRVIVRHREQEKWSGKAGSQQWLKGGCRGQRESRERIIREDDEIEAANEDP